MFSLVSLGHNSHRVMWVDDPGKCCTCNGFASQLKNTRLKKIQSFIMSHKQPCQNFAPEQDVIFIILIRKQVCPRPRRKHCLYSHSCLLCKHPCKDSLKQKLFISLLKRIAKNERPMENCLSTQVWITLSLENKWQVITSTEVIQGRFLLTRLKYFSP